MVAEVTTFDFVAAVAVDAIVGRVPNSSTTSFLQGAVALVTVFAAHAAVTPSRERAEVLRAGLTHADLLGLLRQYGIFDLAKVRYLIFEQRGRSP